MMSPREIHELASTPGQEANLPEWVLVPVPEDKLELYEWLKNLYNEGTFGTRNLITDQEMSARLSKFHEHVHLYGGMEAFKEDWDAEFRPNTAYRHTTVFGDRRDKRN